MFLSLDAVVGEAMTCVRWTRHCFVASVQRLMVYVGKRRPVSAAGANEGTMCVISYRREGLCSARPLIDKAAREIHFILTLNQLCVTCSRSVSGWCSQ